MLQWRSACALLLLLVLSVFLPVTTPPPTTTTSSNGGTTTAGTIATRDRHFWPGPCRCTRTYILPVRGPARTVVAVQRTRCQSGSAKYRPSVRTDGLKPAPNSVCAKRPSVFSWLNTDGTLCPAHSGSTRRDFDKTGACQWG
jgi:hypothetical protein